MNVVDWWDTFNLLCMEMGYVNKADSQKYLFFHLGPIAQTWYPRVKVGTDKKLDTVDATTKKWRLREAFLTKFTCDGTARITYKSSINHMIQTEKESCSQSVEWVVDYMLVFYHVPGTKDVTSNQLTNIMTVCMGGLHSPVAKQCILNKTMDTVEELLSHAKEADFFESTCTPVELVNTLSAKPSQQQFQNAALSGQSQSHYSQQLPPNIPAPKEDNKQRYAVVYCVYVYTEPCQVFCRVR